MDATAAARTLGLFRVSLGSAAIAAPRVVARAFGIDPGANPAGPALGRLFGIRNIAVGLAMLRADDVERDRWLAWSMPIDVADAAVVLAGRARGYLSTRTAISGALVAGVAILTASSARTARNG